MAREINRLKQADLADLRPGRYADGAGLYCVVNQSGSRQWFQFYNAAGGRRREMGLGSASEGGITLATARRLAAKVRADVAMGRDPVAEKKAARAKAKAEAEAVQFEDARPTFGGFARDFILKRRDSWKDSRAESNWLWSIEQHAVSLLDKKIDEIDHEAVIAVVEPIWTTKQETARKVRRRIEAILDAARIAGHIPKGTSNPAALKGNLALVLPKAPKGDHHAALDYRNVPTFMADLRRRPVSTGSLAFEFLILTALRTNEVIGAVWSEIDLAEKLWTVPKERMKADREHVVPLAERCVEILKIMLPRRDREHGDFVFPGQARGRPLSNMAFLTLLRRMSVEVTAHGFRSTFRDWVGDETDHDERLAEAALAHSLGAVEAAYRRASAVQKRRLLMDEWSAYCSSSGV